MGSKVKEKNIIYLKEEKNIICIEGKFIDLNLITSIDISKKEVIRFKEVNGTELIISRKKANISFLNLPEKYRKTYYEDEVEKIIKELNSEFDYFYHEYDYDWNYTYKIYNKVDTDKKQKLIDIHWENLKNELLNRWNGITNYDIVTIDLKVINLMREYFKLNSSNPNVLNNIKKMFGYDYGNIINVLDVKGDYYIDNKGNIIEI